MFEIIAKTNGREDCTTAMMRVETTLRCERSAFEFEFGTNEQYSTLLLVERIKHEMGDALAIIRREAYDQGRKDMRARCKKKTHFFQHWNSDGVGW